MQIGSLFMALGFDVDDKKLDEFTGKIGSLRSGLTATAGIAAAGVSALSAMAFAGAKTAMGLTNFESQTNSSMEAVQRLANVATQLNNELSLDDAKAAFVSLYDTIVSAEWGEGATGILAQMGITDVAQKTPTDMINEFRRVWRETTDGISQAKKQKFFEEAGLPRSFIDVIKAPQAEFDKLYNRKIINSSDIENLKELSRELQEVGYKFDYISKKIGAMSADLASSLLKPFNWFAEQNIKIIEGFEKKILNRNPDDGSRIVIKDALDNPTVKHRTVEEVVSFGNFSSLERERVAQQWQNIKNTNNNINIESTADPKELAESLFDYLDQQENRETLGEMPNTAYGGTR